MWKTHELTWRSLKLCYSCAEKVWEKTLRSKQHLLCNTQTWDLCNKRWSYLLGRVGNLGRKSLDSSSELQNELRALQHTGMTKHLHLGDQKSFVPLARSRIVTHTCCPPSPPSSACRSQSSAAETHEGSLLFQLHTGPPAWCLQDWRPVLGRKERNCSLTINCLLMNNKNISWDVSYFCHRVSRL